MWIEELRLRNFRSFETQVMNFGKVNVIVGANAAGKSNLLQALRFLRDISAAGLGNAISIQGGDEYLFNRAIGSLQDMEIGFTGAPRLSLFRLAGSEATSTVFEIAIEGIEYLLGLRKAAARPQRALVVHDEMALKVAIFEREFLEEDLNGEPVYRIGDERRLLARGNMTLRHTSDSVSESRDFELPSGLEEPLLSLDFQGDHGYSSEHALLERFPKRFHEQLGLFDIDPRLGKKSPPVLGKQELEEDGSNLALVLDRIFSKDRDRDAFLNLARTLLPHFQDAAVEQDPDRIRLLVKEAYFKTPIPAAFLSGGTISVMALLVALHFEQVVVAIEEPERNIHPWLIGKVMQVVHELQDFRQAILTTHSPEVVRHAGLENLIYVERNRKGFSSAHRPSESRDIVPFLQNDLGVDDLFVQNLLGI